jgi:phosphatidylinositol alpha-mannosyltransferase
VKLAHVHADLPPDSWGGVAWQVHRLAAAQAERGHDVTVFSYSRPENVRYALAPLGAPGRDRRRGLARLLLAAADVARVDASAFDVVHYHGDSHLAAPKRPSVRTFYGSALSEMLHATSWRFRAAQALTVPMELLAMLRADRAVGISEATRRALPGARTIVPCGVDTRDTFSPGPGRAAEPTVLFVGTLSGRKRGALLLDAFRAVRARVPAARLEVVSDEPASGDGVHWLGRVSEPDLVAAYRRAWVFCLPSSFEGFGVPYVEAMACGTPVVATPNAGAREVTDDGRCARIVPDARLADALADLLLDPAARDALARAGRERAARYDWDRVVELYDGVYADLLGPAMARAGGA